MAPRFENEKHGLGIRNRRATLDGPAAGRSWIRAVPTGAIAVSLLFAGIAWAQDCTALLSLFQQGFNAAQIAEMTGLTGNQVEACRQQLSRPIFVGPAGAPPVNAAGPPPLNPVGPPPLGAAGPPPVGAAGPPPVGQEIKRLP
jgi:hypothetical protein